MKCKAPQEYPDHTYYSEQERMLCKSGRKIQPYEYFVNDVLNDLENAAEIFYEHPSFVTMRCYVNETENKMLEATASMIVRTDDSQYDNEEDAKEAVARFLLQTVPDGAPVEAELEVTINEVRNTNRKWDWDTAMLLPAIKK